MRKGWIWMLCLLFGAGPAWAQATVVEKKTVPFDSLKHRIKADLFAPDFLVGDSHYNAIVSASDGRIHFVINSHDMDHACRHYTFDPGSETIRLVAELDKVLREDARTHVPQGKVHTPMIEHNGKLWFTTHTSFYEHGLPGIDSGDRVPHSGGHFMSYDLATGEYEDLASVFPSEGVITLNMDKANEILYGLTWPSGILVSYDIRKDELRCWGAVQGRGEWGHHPWEWERICRNLGVAPDGKVYGSTMDGGIWEYDATQPRRVRMIEGLDLSRVPFTQSAEETMKGDFQSNWRVIRWNPATASFWGLHFETTTLFEFIPDKAYIRAVAELRPEAYQGMPRNPEISQLGFTIGPKNTIFYLAHGPAVEMEGRPPVQSGLYLLTYAIDSGTLVDHGPIFAADDGRRVFFAESIEIGTDDHIYAVVWVEVIDPERRARIAAARKSGPVETEKMQYEIVLARLPKWNQFVK